MACHGRLTWWWWRRRSQITFHTKCSCVNPYDNIPASWQQIRESLVGGIFLQVAMLRPPDDITAGPPRNQLTDRQRQRLLASKTKANSNGSSLFLTGTTVTSWFSSLIFSRVSALIFVPHANVPSRGHPRYLCAILSSILLEG